MLGAVFPLDGHRVSGPVAVVLCRHGARPHWPAPPRDLPGWVTRTSRTPWNLLARTARHHSQPVPHLCRRPRGQDSRTLLAPGEATAPPGIGAPLSPVGEGIRQGPLEVGRVQYGHPAAQFLPRAGRQLPHDRVENVPGVPHVVERAPAARALRVLRVPGTTSRRQGERPVPPQGPVRGTGVHVVVRRESLDLMHRQAGAGREPGDAARWRITPIARGRSSSCTERAGPATRHGPFGLRSCGARYRPSERRHGRSGVRSLGRCGRSDGPFGPRTVGVDRASPTAALTARPGAGCGAGARCRWWTF